MSAVVTFWSERIVRRTARLALIRSAWRDGNPDRGAARRKARALRWKRAGFSPALLGDYR